MEFIKEQLESEDNSEKISFSNNILQSYCDKLSEDLDVSILNLKEKSLRTSAIRSKWLIYLMKEKENLKKLKERKETLKALLIKSLSQENPSILRQKTEDKILEGNKDLLEIDKAIETLKEVLVFLEYAWNILADFNYNIKNAIDFIRLEQV